MVFQFNVFRGQMFILFTSYEKANTRSILILHALQDTTSWSEGVFSMSQKSIGPHTVYLIGQLYTSCTSHWKGDFIVQTVLYKRCSQYIYVPHKFRGPHPVYLIGEVNIAQVFTKSPSQRSSEEVLSIKISSQDTFYHVISCSLFLSSSLRSPMSRKDTEKS